MPFSLRYVLTDVFTDRPFGGNPLAVFPDAAELTTSEMQSIARELNLSETTFVAPAPPGAEGHTVRIFTPLTELPFAGHPTIGTALVLDSLAKPDCHGATARRYTILLHERIGIVPVEILHSEAARRAVLSSPSIPERAGQPADRAILARLLGLETADVLEGTVAPQCLSAGVPFTFIPVRDRATLSRARLNGAAWQESLADSNAPHIYVMTMSDWREGDTVDARMFAPAMGIPEDPATGVAAVALAGYLSTIQNLRHGRTNFLIRQGEDMGRPSQLDLAIDCDNGRLSGVHVGGQAIIIGQGALDWACLRISAP